MSAAMNPMNQLRITKVAVNIGVGEGGERLVNAEKVLEIVTAFKPQRTLGRIQNRDLKVRQGAPIGCKVTMRDQDRIMAFLKDAFDSVRTPFQRGTSTERATSPSASVTTRISPSKSTTRRSASSAWTSRLSRAPRPPCQSPPPSPQGEGRATAPRHHGRGPRLVQGDVQH